MNLKQLINKSVYGTIGYIGSQDDIDVLESYILYNLPVLKEYKQIVVATNYGFPLQNENTQLWKKYFPNCVIIDSEVNRGHNFGTADLDNMLFDWCKENNEEWLCKSANDMIFQESILEKEVDNAEFYYLTSVGLGAFPPPFEVSVEKVYDTHEYFYPQTNYYFINVFKINELNDKNHINSIYKIYQTNTDLNKKAWDVGFKTCEVLLKETIENNKLSTFNLISRKKFHILLNTIKEYQIHDPSHKNIMMEGICHLQFNQHPIIEI